MDSVGADRCRSDVDGRPRPHGSGGDRRAVDARPTIDAWRTELGTPSPRLLRTQAGRARKRTHPRSGMRRGVRSTAPPERSVVGELGPTEGVFHRPASDDEPVPASQTDGRAPMSCDRWMPRADLTTARGRRRPQATPEGGGVRRWGTAVGYGGGARRWGTAVGQEWTGWCCAEALRGPSGTPADDVGPGVVRRATEGRRPGASDVLGGSGWEAAGAGGWARCVPRWRGGSSSTARRMGM